MQYLLSDKELIEAQETLRPYLTQAQEALSVGRNLIMELSTHKCIWEGDGGYYDDCPIAAIEGDEKIVCRIDKEPSHQISQWLWPLERKYSPKMIFVKK